MKIALCSNYQFPHLGGMDELCHQLKQAYLRAGHQVTWITSDLPRGGRPSTADNIRIPAWNGPEEWLQVNCPVVNPFHLFSIIRTLRSHDAVHVHSLAPGVTTLVFLAALITRKRLVVSQQVGLIPLRFPLLNYMQDTILPALAKLAVRRGASLTFPSLRVRDYFAERGRLNPEDMPITPNAHDKAVFTFAEQEERDRAIEQLELPDSRLRVLYAGRFVGKKGIHYIRDLAAALPDISFTLVGEGVMRPDLWKLPNVKTLPALPSAALRPYFAAHDVLLLPSVAEGWPLVICEAMACGLPCVISRETFENFGQDEEMFVVSDLRHESLRAALEDCAAGKSDLLQRRRELASYAAATWDWDRTAKQFLDLFRQESGCTEISHASEPVSALPGKSEATPPVA